MRTDRQLARLMAAMIVMIITYVVPSAVQAHEGHRHTGHNHAVMTETHVQRTVAPSSREIGTSVAVVTATLVPVLLGVTEPVAVAALQAADRDSGCCPVACKGSCCGTMACHAVGILAGPASLPKLAYGHVVLLSHDVNGRSGIGPEALPRPPRTLA
jgi:hypothetical protein